MPSHYEACVEKLFEGEKFGSILDIGCGPLQYLDTIQKINPQARVAGFDKDTGMVKTAQERLLQLGMVNSEVVLHHIHAEPWPFDEDFDSIALIAVLLILNDEDAEIVMRNVKKRLRKRLLILDIDGPGIEGISVVGRSRNFHAFLKHHGFKNITIESVSGWPGGSGGHIIKANV